MAPASLTAVSAGPSPTLDHPGVADDFVVNHAWSRSLLGYGGQAGQVVQGVMLVKGTTLMRQGRPDAVGVGWGDAAVQRRVKRGRVARAGVAAGVLSGEPQSRPVQGCARHLPGRASWASVAS